MRFVKNLQVLLSAQPFLGGAKNNARLHHVVQEYADGFPRKRGEIMVENRCMHF